jgi:hypothetical protein
MKKILIALIALFLCLFILPTITEASQTKLGRLFDFISDPSNPAHKNDRNNYIAWAKQSFTEHNIPLMSTMKLDDGPVLGIDSVFKYNPVDVMARFWAWRRANSIDESTVRNLPWLVYNPYWGESSLSVTPRGLINQAGVGVTATLPELNRIMDSLEEANGSFPAAMPLTVTSEFKDGTITGTVKIQITKLVNDFQNHCHDNNKPGYVRCQIILAEGYHKYGAEEHYFIPRKCFYTDNNLGGGEIQIPKNPTSGTTTFSFEVDKSWNTKYLYVIAIAELYPCDTILNRRFLLDVAVDRVVDVRAPTLHTPIKLEVDYANPAHKCQKVVVNAENVTIGFKITNPTASTVKALVYIDKNTSVMNDWEITKNRDTVIIPAGGNTTVVLTGKAPSFAGAAAIDFCVLPVDTKENENPIISNILAVAVTDSTKILALANRMQPFILGTAGSVWYENISVIPDKYFFLIPPNMFEGYFFSYTNLTQGGEFDPSVPYKSSSAFVGSVDSGYSREQEFLFNDVLDVERLKFLNSIIAEKKYLALFIDRSPSYSTTASAEERGEYETLFYNFGVSFKNEKKLNGENGIAVYTAIKGVSDILTAVNKDYNNILSFDMNGSSTVIYEPAVTDWTITNTSKTTKVFYCNDDFSTISAVKCASGNYKMFLAGFGLDAISSVEQVNRLPHLLGNIVTWWLGEKALIKPRITIDSVDIKFGSMTVGQDAAVRRNIVISNVAEGAENILKIYNSTGFTNNYDEAFKVVRKLKSEIKAGEKDTLIIEFDPKTGTEAGLDINVTYKIMSNDPSNSSLNLYFTGKSILTKPLVPELIINDGKDDFYNFGKFDSGVAGPTTTIEYYMYNNGGVKLEISSIELSSETDNEVFVLQNHTNIKEINPNQEKNFRLRVMANKVGIFDGKIIITSNDPKKSVYELEFLVEILGVGISEEVAKMFNCNISPNPTSGVIIIDFNVIGELSRNVLLNIVDNSGRLVRTIVNSQYAPGNYKETLDISNLPAGVYYIEYTIDNKKSASSITIVK